jgi:Domain of unknown function (DUF4224)
MRTFVGKYDHKPLLLTAIELADLTGYRQPARQARWLSATLRITPPRRADGMLVVSRAQVENALAGQRAAVAEGPKWSTA